MMNAPQTATAIARRSLARGFTLLEMMLVVVIIGLLAMVVVINFAGQTDKVKTQLTKTSFTQVKNALIQYSTEKGSYPPTLQDLVTAKMLDKIPQDGWKHQIFYAFPGNSADRENQPYDLYSAGKDGVSGTADDISVWTMDQ